MSNKKNSVDIIGKIAKFPNDVQAHKAYMFMENIKIAKNKVWYIMVQKQDDQLQMVKYNRVEGVNLNDFMLQLKEYYKQKYSNNNLLLESLDKIEVTGEDKFSIIRNIPQITIENKSLISKITEDLIVLLSSN